MHGRMLACRPHTAWVEVWGRSVHTTCARTCLLRRQNCASHWIWGSLQSASRPALHPAEQPWQLPPPCHRRRCRPTPSRVSLPRQTSGVPTQSAIVDPVGLKATEQLLNTMYTATRPRSLDGDPGGAAANIPNARDLHRQAGNLLKTLG